MAAGLLADPYLDRNELDAEWVGHQSWKYSTTFDWADDGRRQRRPGLRGTGHGCHGDAQRRGDRANEQHASSLPVPGASSPGSGGKHPERELRLRLGFRGGRTRPLLVTYRTPTRAVQLHPQDGLQLRLGLGPDAGHRRHLAPGRAATLGRRPARRGPAAGHRRADEGVARFDLSVDGADGRAPTGHSPWWLAWETGWRASRSRPASATSTSRSASPSRTVVAAGDGDQPTYDLDVTYWSSAGCEAGRLVTHGSASARCASTPPPTSTAHPSPSSSTTCRSSCAAPTGSRTTRSPTGSPGSGIAERFSKPPTRT